MTAKRFGYGAGVNWQEDVIIDYKTEKSYTFYEVGKLLNELAEENQVLKHSQSSTLREFEKGVKKIQLLSKESQQLKEENEQLKEQLEMCKDARQAYKQDWKACVSYCDTYKDEIHTLKDNIQGLIEENKQLKSRVDDLKYQLNYVTKCKEMCFKDIEILDKKYEKLYDENKELKQNLRKREVQI